MSVTRLLLLLLATLLAAGLLYRLRAERADTGLERAGESILPELSGRINDVAAISLLSAEERFTIRRGAEGWVLSEKADYPARFEAVKTALLGLADLTIVESRTSTPRLYPALGVEDPEAPDARSLLVTLLDSEDRALCALIVGQPASGRDQLHVRRPSEAQAWLVRGKLRLERRAAGWLERTLPSLPADRVARLEIRREAEPAVIVTNSAAQGGEVALEGVPEDRSAAGEPQLRAALGGLAALDFEEVQSAAEPLPTEAGRVTAEFTTFDGLRLTATTVPASPPDPEAAAAGACWLQLSVAAIPEAAEEVVAEAERWQRAVANWSFRLSEYRARSLRHELEDLLVPVGGEADALPPDPDGLDFDDLDFEGFESFEDFEFADPEHGHAHEEAADPEDAAAAEDTTVDPVPDQPPRDG